MDENQNVQNQYQQPANNKKGMAIAAMVLGIVSIVLLCFIYVSVPCGIIAIILGAISKKDPACKGLATAGIVTGCIGIGLTVLYIVFLSSLFATLLAGASSFGY